MLYWSSSSSTFCTGTFIRKRLGSLLSVMGANTLLIPSDLENIGSFQLHFYREKGNTAWSFHNREERHQKTLKKAFSLLLWFSLGRSRDRLSVRMSRQLLCKSNCQTRASVLRRFRKNRACFSWMTCRFSSLRVEESVPLSKTTRACLCLFFFFCRCCFVRKRIRAKFWNSVKKCWHAQLYLWSPLKNTHFCQLSSALMQ